jgi:hypothetical protein
MFRSTWTILEELTFSLAKVTVVWYCCIPSRWLKSGTSVVTERLVPEGCWYGLRAGHFRIDIQDSKHNSLGVEYVGLL